MTHPYSASTEAQLGDKKGNEQKLRRLLASSTSVCFHLHELLLHPYFHHPFRLSLLLLPRELLLAECLRQTQPLLQPFPSILSQFSLL